MVPVCSADQSMRIASHSFHICLAYAQPYFCPACAPSAKHDSQHSGAAARGMPYKVSMLVARQMSSHEPASGVLRMLQEAFCCLAVVRSAILDFPVLACGGVCRWYQSFVPNRACALLHTAATFVLHKHSRIFALRVLQAPSMTLNILVPQRAVCLTMSRC